MESLPLYMKYYTFYLKIIIYISNFKCFVTKGNYFCIIIVNTYICIILYLNIDMYYILYEGLQIDSNEPV